MALQFTRGAGGQFSGSVGGVPMPPAMAALYARLNQAAGGKMSFNGRTGTGYDLPHGDARVKLLQNALNDAGFTDAQGHPLAVDGRLGPLTTQAIRAAQKQLGLPTDGVVTPKLLAQIMGLPPGKRPAEKPAPRMTARQALRPARRPAPEKPAPKSSPAREPSLQRGAVKFR